MTPGAVGRLPHVPDPNRRLSPLSICDIKDGYLLQDNIRQLIVGLLHGFQSAHVVWEGLPLSAPRGASTVEMDWVTWRNQLFDYAGRPTTAFIDFESSVRYLEDSDEYVAAKTLNVKRLVDFPGGIRALVKNLRAHPDYQAFPELTEPPVVYLVFMGNRADSLPEANELQKLLRGKKGKLEGSDPTISCVRAGEEGSARLVTLGDGSQIHVGLVNKEKILELTYQAFALNHAKQNDLVDERFLHEITSLSGRPLLLDAMPRKLAIQAASTPAPVVIEGKHVVYYRFSVNPIDFLRLTTVMRLVSDYDYLQRLPEGPHLQDMAADVQGGGRFPTPVLVIPADHNRPVANLDNIVHAGGACLSPYRWHIIDGQHRVYSYYLVQPGIGLQSLDVNCYEPAAPTDKSVVASALFLNVNFKALKPPIDLALAHGAFADLWPGGVWIPRKRGRQSGGDSKLYSSRLLASRFLLELSAAPSVFKDFFKHIGTTDHGKASIQSISTYLGDDFNIRDPADSSNLIACRFGTVPRASGIWTVPDPSPGVLRPLWDELVAGFDDFVRDVATGGGQSLVVGKERLRALVLENNNVFVALWRAFFWYSFEKHPGGTNIPPVPKRLAGRVLPWLVKQSETKRLSGSRNAYRSGSGAVRLSQRLIEKIGGP